MSMSLIIRASGPRPCILRFASSKLRTVQNSPLQISQASRKVRGSYLTLQLPVRCLSSSSLNYQAQQAVANTQNVDKDPFEVDVNDYRERYIPLTRETLIRFLMEEKDFFTEEEKKLFPDFARSCDKSLTNHYKGILSELKSLFDPINPDNDTLQNRKVSRREKLDSEFWLLQQLHEVMKKANFQELPKSIVERFLKERDHDGIQVSVDWNRYDVLRFWVLGHEQPDVSLSFMEKLSNFVLRRKARAPQEYYKRVVVAIRLKKDSKLILKAFKEVPVQNLEMLLPDGTLKMSTLDKGVLMSSITIAGVGILAKVVTYLAALHVEWTLVIASITGLIGFRAWTLYKNKRNEYLIKVTRMLYYKNIANNRSLLTVLVDRAEDECFKEALLTYALLLTSRSAKYRNKALESIPVSERGGLRVEDMEKQAEEWLEKKTGVKLRFDSSEALPILQNLGLVNDALPQNDFKLTSSSLEVARSLLPRVPISVIGREPDDVNIVDGFDRDIYLETEDEYKKEDERRNKYGWF